MVICWLWFWRRRFFDVGGSGPRPDQFFRELLFRQSFREQGAEDVRLERAIGFQEFRHANPGGVFGHVFRSDGVRAFPGDAPESGDFRSVVEVVEDFFFSFFGIGFQDSGLGDEFRQPGRVFRNFGEARFQRSGFRQGQHFLRRPVPQRTGVLRGAPAAVVAEARPAAAVHGVHHTVDDGDCFPVGEFPGDDLLLVAEEEVAGDFIQEFPFHEGFRVRGLLFPVVADLAAFEVEEFAQRGAEAVRFPACHSGVPLREGAAFLSAMTSSPEQSVRTVFTAQRMDFFSSACRCSHALNSSTPMSRSRKAASIRVPRWAASPASGRR